MRIGFDARNLATDFEFLVLVLKSAFTHARGFVFILTSMQNAGSGIERIEEEEERRRGRRRFCIEK